MNPLHLLWIVPLLAPAAFVVCGCAVAGKCDASSERDAAQVKDECYYCPFPCDHHK